ncbi:MAG TPA: mandelate racemase/muconate lactonizing enzyme family protein [Nitrolancea sp.]|nr:mandelate racemase/muconate lactonizing enzyme family protein [Nitrolancea sp.]
MKVRAIRWTPFRVPFAAGFTTAAGEMTVREGVLLQLMTSDGITGLGEGSPLAAFGGGTVADVLAVLQDRSPALIGADLASVPGVVATLPRDRSGAAAAYSALDIAAWDALGRSRGVRVASLLGGSVTPIVPVNATVGASTAESAATAARAAVDAGFHTVKLKVGIAGSPEAEAERVAAVREAIGLETGLRLDANGAWTEDEAIETIRRLEAFRPQYIEQPLPAGDPAALARVRHAVMMPVAADEAVTDLAAVKALIGAAAADVLIVKPMAVGGLEPARTIVELGTLAGLRVVVTTTIDTGIGISAALHLAATLSRPIPACGLATGPLLASDLLVEPLVVRDGEMRLPAGRGLGVAIDEAQLAQYATGAGAGVGY